MFLLGQLVPDGLCVLDVAFEVSAFESEVDARGGSPRELVHELCQRGADVLAGSQKPAVGHTRVEPALFVLVERTEPVVAEPSEDRIPGGLELSHVDDASNGVRLVCAAARVGVHEVAEEKWEKSEDAKLGVMRAGRVLEGLGFVVVVLCVEETVDRAKLPEFFESEDAQ